jgi:hypothetical protein
MGDVASMLKNEVPPDQIQAVQPILVPLLERLRSQALKLPPQADSALVFLPEGEYGDPEASR